MDRIPQAFQDQFSARLADLDLEQREEVLALLDIIPERELAGLVGDMARRPEPELVGAS